MATWWFSNSILFSMINNCTLIGRNFPLLHIYLFFSLIYLYHHRLINSYLFSELWPTNNVFYFVTLIIPDLAIGSPIKLAPLSPWFTEQYLFSSSPKFPWPCHVGNNHRTSHFSNFCSSQRKLVFKWIWQYVCLFITNILSDLREYSQETYINET